MAGGEVSADPHDGDAVTTALAPYQRDGDDGRLRQSDRERLADGLSRGGEAHRRRRALGATVALHAQLAFAEAKGALHLPAPGVGLHDALGICLL